MCMIVKTTPWGPVQQCRHLSSDVTFVKTASHGGFHVTGETLADICESFPHFWTFGHFGVPLDNERHAKECWFEEDCDASLVVFADAELFEEYVLDSAIAIVRGLAKTQVKWEYVAQRMDEIARKAKE